MLPHPVVAEDPLSDGFEQAPLPGRVILPEQERVRLLDRVRFDGRLLFPGEGFPIGLEG